MKAARRRLWTLGISGLAGVVVLASTLSGAITLAIQGAPQYRELVVQRASQVLRRPVTVAGMRIVWRRLQPTVELDQVSLGGPEPLSFRRVRLGFSLLDLAVGHVVPRSLDVAGGALVVERDASGHWILHGWTPGSLSSGGQPPQWDEISVEDIAVQLQSARPHLLVDLRVLGGIVRRRSSGFRLRAEFIPPPQIASQGSVSGSFEGLAMHPETWEGDGALELQDLRGIPDIGGLLASGTSVFFQEATAQLSAHVEHGIWRSAHLDLQAAGVHAHGRGLETESLHGLVLQVVANHPGPDWGLELRRLSVTGGHGTWPDAHGHLTLSPNRAGEGMTATGSLDFVRLDDVLPWFWLWKGARAWPKWIQGLRGDLSQVDGTVANLASHEPPRLSLTAQVHALGWPPDANRPGMQGLSGTLNADQAHGVFTLSGGPVRVNWPYTFDQDLPFDALAGTLSWTYGEDAWSASIPNLSWRALETRGSASLAFGIPKAGASLTAHVALRGEAANALRLLPLLPHTWGQDCRLWLRRAIRGGRIENLRLVLDGPVADYPFDRRATGTWAVDFDTREGTLAFSPQWPAVQDLEAHVALRGNGIQIQSRHGRLQALQVENVDARIPDFATGQLTVDGTSRGGAKDYFSLLAQSPIAGRFSGLLGHTRWDGPADNSLHLQIALVPALDVTASGEFRMDGDTLQVSGVDAPLQQLTGAVDFGPQGPKADHLTATLMHAPLQGSISSDATHPDGLLRAQAAVDFDAADGLAAHYLPAAIREHLHGSTALSGEWVLAASTDRDLHLHSDLVGLRSDFPAPLQKAADAASAIDIHITSPAPSPLVLGIELQDTVGATLRFAGTSGAPQLKGLALRVGPGAPPVADADGLRISGHPPRLFLGGWLDFIGASGTGAPKTAASHLPFLGADLTADQVVWDNFTIDATHLRIAPAPGGFTADLDGVGAAGHVDYQSTPAALKAHLDHLLLGPAAEAAAVSAAPAPSASQPFDPASAPTLEIRCDQLKMSDMLLGSLSMHTSRVADGQRLDALEVSHGNLSLKAAGTWRRTPGGSSAETGFSLATSDILPLLAAFGYQQSVQAHRALFVGQLAWPKTSEGLTLARAQGDVKLDLNDGVLKSVNASNAAGRALGLLNLYALPRRFLLDFRDVVDKGLVFDKLSGSFKLADGQATTDDLDIKAPSMKMQVRGRIGLAARDFDQRVTVVPEVSTTVTVGATLLGGPVGGAIALIAQELFGKPLNKLSELRYHLTGSWDNPQIEKASKS